LSATTTFSNAYCEFETPIESASMGMWNFPIRFLLGFNMCSTDIYSYVVQ
jgi:hypothetical protein